MNQTRVKDIMVPLDDYAVVPPEATLRDAVVALDRAQKHVPPGRQPHRAVLVKDKQGRIIGKVGQLAFLKGLEPNYEHSIDTDALERAGVGDGLITAMREHTKYFEESLDDVCAHAATTKVGAILQPFEESIDENALLGEAVHKIVQWQRLSLLVTRGEQVVGIVRLSDLFDTIATKIKQMNDK